MAIPDYKLSAVLVGHSLDVRCVSLTKESCILSASRDKTAKLWHPEGVKDFVNVVTYKGHKNFVSAVCWLPPCEAFHDGLVITGSNDNTILGYNLQDGMIQITLQGHENAVCCVTPSQESGILLSSSWDNTAKVWNINNPNSSPLTLTGHQAAVWAVVELGNGTYATASADKFIGLWNKQGAKLKLLAGHTDCVRGLTVANPETFLSCANDASIRLWTNNGECLNTYYGHTNYIYSITSVPGIEGGCFASCGEDGSLRVWTGGDCVNQLVLPAQSVWCLTALPNGDIVTGSSDGLVRVFTNDESRAADAVMLAAFEEEVKKMQDAQKKEIGGYKLSDIPGPEALLSAGRTEGETRMVRRGDSVKCYSWSAHDAAWRELGDVTGAAPATPGKTLYQGKEYDFVFSVDIQDGVPPLKLPYNVTEDPWVAAQTFIHKNDLPQVYLDQVANFIITNAKLDTIPQTPNNNGYADPFTGESRYVPSSAAAATPTPVLPGAPTEEKSLIPHDSYIRLDQGNFRAIRDKLVEFNEKVGDGVAPFTLDQIDNIVKLGELNCTYDPESVSHLKQMLQWPKEILFPVLDVARLAVRNKEINELMFAEDSNYSFVEFLMSLLDKEGVSVNVLVSMRVLVNSFSAAAGELQTARRASSLLTRLPTLLPASPVPPASDNLQVAASSLALNVCVATSTEPAAAAAAAAALPPLLLRLRAPHAYLRGIVALGTLLIGCPEQASVKSAITSNTALHSKIRADSELVSDDPTMRKIASCSRHILRIL